MDDIVERLRQRPWRSAAENEYEAKERRQREREEAADEITALRAENERLRAALWDIHAICNNGPFVWAKRIRAIARAVLEGKL